MDKIVFIGVGLLIILIAVFLVFPVPEKTCEENYDCVVFGETGDCNCGCYHIREIPKDTGGECFCQAPTYCECVQGKCEPRFAEISSFHECAQYFPVMESYPEQCSSGDKTFTRNVIDPYNTEYIINNETILLENGYSEIEQASGSASKLVTQVALEPVYRDINSNGIDDIALVLTQRGGGSGTFYYLILIIDTTRKEIQLAGDRIIVQDILMDNSSVWLNVLDREIDEPMSTEPSVPKTVRIKI